MSQQRIHVISEGVVASYLNDISTRRPAEPPRAARPQLHARRARVAPRVRPARRRVTVSA
jgi:hypothetical protein